LQTFQCKSYEEITDLLRKNLAKKEKLRPFQKDGVLWIESREGRGLIGDEMGLGKTVQALAWLAIHPELRPAVVVCPASVKLNWVSEIHKWMKKPEKITVLRGQRPGAVQGDIIIVNYTIVANKYTVAKDMAGRKRATEVKGTGWVDYIKELKPQVIVIDEGHMIKNPKAFRAKSVRKLCRRVKHVLPLTGTPIENGPYEFYNMINLLDRNMFSFWGYVQRYCKAKMDYFGRWDYSGASHMDELNKKLKKIMIRRLKKDVARELPEKTKTIVPIETFGTMARYHEAVQLLLMPGLDKAERKERAEAVKRSVWKVKKKMSIQWISDFLESGEKLIVYAWNKEVIKDLMTAFKKVAVKLDGSVSTDAKRQAAVQKFMRDPGTRLLVANYKVVIGLTLTAASNTAWVQYPWTPGVMDQADDRVHRIGQRKPVNNWYLVAEGTLETDLLELIDKKRQVLSQVLDGQEVEKGSLLMELLDKLREEQE